MSGLTTTGATVIVGLDAARRGILLWRALLQWLGGIGIIAVASAILPALGVGGMQLFRTESSDRSEKVMPRVRADRTGDQPCLRGPDGRLCRGLLARRHDALRRVAHALTTVSTAGFSTSDASMGHWDNAAARTGSRRCSCSPARSRSCSTCACCSASGTHCATARSGPCSALSRS